MDALIEIMDSDPVYMDIRMGVSYPNPIENSLLSLTGGSSTKTICIADDDRKVELRFDQDAESYRLIELTEYKSTHLTQSYCEKKDIKIPPVVQNPSLLGSYLHMAGRVLSDSGYALIHNSKAEACYVTKLDPVKVQVSDDEGGKIDAMKQTRVHVCLVTDNQTVVIGVRVTASSDWELI